jgi:CheY-like chemotaxis protein
MWRHESVWPRTRRVAVALTVLNRAGNLPMTMHPCVSDGTPMNKEALSVLVIDDDPDIAAVVEAILHRAGWKVTVCLHPKAAARLAQSIRPHVILCDANMPEMSGPEAIALLKSELSTARIPVVLMTGFSEAELFVDVDWTAFIEKPFTPKALLTVIERAAHSVIPSRITHHA